MPVEIAAGGPPPRKTPAASTGSKPAAVKATPRLTDDRYKALAGLGAIAQVPLIATKQYADAGAIGIHWPNVAKELAKLAETQEQIAQLIDPLIKIGPYTGLVTAILPLIMQIGVNHNRVAPGAMGTVPGTLLASQIEGAIAQQELEALRVQMQAEKDAAAMRKEIQEQRDEMAAQAA